MALDRPRLGEEPDPGTCNGLHIHLVEYACEELWSLADDSEDEQASTYDQQAEQLMCAGGTPANRDLLVWLQDKMPAAVYQKVLQEAARVEWPFLPATAAHEDDATAGDRAHECTSTVEAVTGCDSGRHASPAGWRQAS